MKTIIKEELSKEKEFIKKHLFEEKIALCQELAFEHRRKSAGAHVDFRARVHRGRAAREYDHLL